MNIPKISALYESSLASALSSTGTSFTLVSATDRDGNALSGRYGFIIEEGSADEEFVIGTVSGTAVTIEYRGIDADAPNTEVSANKKGHRRGASVKITDYPILGVVRNILNGDESLPNPLKYASGVTPVSADDLVDKAYADALVGGGSLSYDRIVISGNAGETVSAGQILYLNTADGEWYKADADTAAQVENVNLGIAQGAGTDGNGIAGGVLTYGLDTNQTGLSLNTKYYASNTAGGLSSTPGTKEVTLGVSRSATSIFFSPRYDQQITEDEQDALAGTVGTPSSTNKFITELNLTDGGADQSQSTQNATVETGEADSTLKKNLIAQSFVPSKTKIRGVKLYKSADTGTFAGTVVISLQADSSGSPSGVNLATVTISNATWVALPVGEFTALFTSEYQSLSIGSTYWIVIDPSTSDNSNHPNLGTNSAGGYSSGSVKFKNTTDGWTAISTIDLYFKTISGAGSQVVKTGSDGFTDPTLIGTSKKVFISTTEVTYTDGNGGAGAGSEQTLFSTTVPAGLLGSNNAIRFSLFVSSANVAGQLNSWQFKVKFGGSTQLTMGNPAPASDVTSVVGLLQGYIIGDGATNVQKMTAFGTLTNSSNAERGNDASVTQSKIPFYANAAGAIDSTVDQPLVITLTQTNSVANDAVVEWCIIESIR